MGCIVSVPDHCLSFYFPNITGYDELKIMMTPFPVPR